MFGSYPLIDSASHYIEHFLRYPDPASIVNRYLPVHIPSRTEVTISMDPSLDGIVFNGTLFATNRILYHKFHSYVNEASITSSMSGKIKMLFERDCFSFEIKMKDLLARLCEIKHHQVKCEVVFNLFAYSITPTCVHPDVPVTMSDFKKSSPAPTTATLLNWFLRLMVYKNKDGPFVHNVIEFFDDACREVEDDVFQHIMDLLSIPDDHMSDSDYVWFFHVIALKRTFPVDVRAQSGIEAF